MDATGQPQGSASDRVDGLMRSMTDLCRGVAAGDYEDADGLFALTGDDLPSEISDLAEAFGMMIVQVEVREFGLKQTIDELRETQRQLEHAKGLLDAENKTLRRKVSELQIEVDQTKKEAEVSEITGTDYFRDLQSKARAMRSRTRG